MHTHTHNTDVLYPHSPQGFGLGFERLILFAAHSTYLPPTLSPRPAGFGLGFERLILFATGMENIRDVIPFPRWPGHAEF